MNLIILYIYKDIFIYHYIDCIMSGGLMDLVANGCQDVYLQNNPAIAYFKITYRKHTNFSMEIIDNNKEIKYIEPIDDIYYNYSNDIIDNIDKNNLFDIDKYIENINTNDNTIYI